MTLAEWVDFGIRILEALAWPAAVIFLAYYLRGPIISLLQQRGGDIRFPGGGGVSIPAQTQPDVQKEEAEEAAKLAEEIESEDTEHGGDEPVTEEEVEEAKRRLNEAHLQREVSRLKLELFFERTVQWIYGSQLGLMYELAASDDGSLPFERVFDWYMKYYSAVSALGREPFSLTSWLHYLEGRDFIAAERTTIQGLLDSDPLIEKAEITDLGSDFVAYCQKQGIQPEIRRW